MKTIMVASCVVAVVGLLPAANTAQALTISPLDAFLQDVVPTTTGTGEIIDEINFLCPSCNIDNAGPDATKIDEINNPGNDPTINLTGGQYLLVKDGNHFPAWYLFDLLALGWAGPVESITLDDFWPEEPGSISHVASYGTVKPPSSVPEPSSLSLLAFGFLGLGAAHRRRTSAC